MLKISVLLGCLLLGACKNEMEVDPQINTVDEIVRCEGMESICEILTNDVVERLPLELQDKIVDTSDRLVIYAGDGQDFVDYVWERERTVKSLGFSGVTLYSKRQPTRIYALADSYVILHELGHAYDYTYWHNGNKKLLSHSKEWTDTYATEFVSQYGQISAQEFYAETFSLYFEDPELLQKLCPKAYELHEKEFKDMK